MKYAIALGTFLLALFIIQTQPNWLVYGWSAVKDFSYSKSYDKHVEFSGNTILTRADLLKRLPMDRSVFWWILNPKEIEVSLSTEQLLSDAKVSSCSRWYVSNWGCFTITVVERLPAFVALFSDKAWLVGQDGGFLSPLPKDVDLDKAVNKLERKFGRMWILKGLEDVKGSPDLIRSRFEFARDSLKLIEQGSEFGIQWAQVSHPGELVVKFKRYPFPVTFGGPDASEENWVSQAHRFQILISKLQNRIERIERVDMAYSILGVVQYYPEN